VHAPVPALRQVNPSATIGNREIAEIADRRRFPGGGRKGGGGRRAARL